MASIQGICDTFSITHNEYEPIYNQVERDVSARNIDTLRGNAGKEHILEITKDTIKSFPSVFKSIPLDRHLDFVSRLTKRALTNCQQRERTGATKRGEKRPHWSEREDKETRIARELMDTPPVQTLDTLPRRIPHWSETAEYAGIFDDMDTNNAHVSRGSTMTAKAPQGFKGVYFQDNGKWLQTICIQRKNNPARPDILVCTKDFLKPGGHAKDRPTVYDLSLKKFKTILGRDWLPQDRTHLTHASYRIS